MTDDMDIRELKRRWAEESKHVNYEGDPDGATLMLVCIEALNFDSTDSLQLQILKFRIRSNLVSAAKGTVKVLYNIEGVVREDMTVAEARTARKQLVKYLVDEDRFICPPEKYEAVSFLFTAPAISQFIYQHFYGTQSARGSKDPSFLAKINGVFLCVVTTALWHGLISWESGDQQSLPKFCAVSCGGQYIYFYR